MYNAEENKNYYKDQIQPKKHSVGPSMRILMLLMKRFWSFVLKT
jgi:hypothetical protein